MDFMDRATRHRIIGPHVAPEGYYEASKRMPFLGQVTCRTETVEAGSWQEIVLDYEVGASGLADGAWIKATFKFYSDWALFQTADPTKANYISAEYQAGPLFPGQEPATVQSLSCRFDQKGHERPFQKAIIVDVIDGYLNPGDHILIRLGDRRAGGSGTRVQTFVEKDFRFRLYIDPVGTSRFSAVPGDVVMQIVPGPAERLIVTAPRLIRPDVAIRVHLRTEDSWGNTTVDGGDTVLLTAHHADAPPVVTHAVLSDDGWAIATVDSLKLDQPGEFRLEAHLADRPRVLPGHAYVSVDSAARFERIFYGDLHVHSDDTVGTNDTVYNLGYGRDVAGLDVLGYTANDFQITEARWNQAVAHVNTMNQDGSFVCYPGTEWCGNSCAGGDHNVVFLHDRVPEFPFDRNGNLVRSFEWNEEMASDRIEPGAWPLEDVYATYAHDPEGHLLIPHVGGRRCNLGWHHPALERLVEIGSAWGHFPWLLQDAVARGYKIGVSANSDEHRGRCGGGAPGTAVFGTKGGLTGILADRLDRNTIGQALRARHTFATTGERTVGLAWSGAHLQGDEFTHAGELRVDYRFLGDIGFDMIEAYDHTGCIWSRDLQREAGFSQHRLRVYWGGARIRDRYRWAAWHGRITVTGATILGHTAFGFEHQEETIRRSSPVTVDFHSDTFGDRDTIELELDAIARATILVEGTIGGYVKVGDARAGNGFVHQPTFRLETDGSHLLQNDAVTANLAGIDMHVSIQRLADQDAPRDVQGSFVANPDNGPHGHRQIYLVGRQRDGSAVYTSPLIVMFT